MLTQTVGGCETVTVHTTDNTHRLATRHWAGRWYGGGENTSFNICEYNEKNAVINVNTLKLKKWIKIAFNAFAGDIQLMALRIVCRWMFMLLMCNERNQWAICRSTTEMKSNAVRQETKQAHLSSSRAQDTTILNCEVGKAAQQPYAYNMNKWMNKFN